jgi:hypothetical protein
MSTSSPQAFVPVAVIILVPIDVDCEAATVEGVTGAGDLPVATLPGDSEAARAAGVALLSSSTSSGAPLPANQQPGSSVYRAPFSRRPVRMLSRSLPASIFSSSFWTSLTSTWW